MSGTMDQAGFSTAVDSTRSADMICLAVQLLGSIKGHDGRPALQAEPSQVKQTWVVSLAAEQPISLWSALNAELELTAEVSRR